MAETSASVVITVDSREPSDMIARINRALEQGAANCATSSANQVIVAKQMVQLPDGDYECECAAQRCAALFERKTITDFSSTICDKVRSDNLLGVARWAYRAIERGATRACINLIIEGDTSKLEQMHISKATHLAMRYGFSIWTTGSLDETARLIAGYARAMATLGKNPTRIGSAATSGATTAPLCDAKQSDDTSQSDVDHKWARKIYGTLRGIGPARMQRAADEGAPLSELLMREIKSGRSEREIMEAILSLSTNLACRDAVMAAYDTGSASEHSELMNVLSLREGNLLQATLKKPLWARICRALASSVAL